MTDKLLKILSGTQLGAEVLLAPGRYVLGSGESADMLLSDAAVRPEHAVLEGGDDGWRVEPVGGAPVLVGGRRISGATPLTDYETVGLGGVYFALGPNGPWETLPGLPEIHLEEKAPDAEAVIEQTPVDSSFSNPGGEPDSVPARAGSSWGQRLVWLALAAALLFIGWLGWSFLTRPSPEEEMAADTVRSLADAAIPARYPAAAPPPGTVGVSVRPDGKIRIHGLLSKAEDVARAKAAITVPDDKADIEIDSFLDEIGMAAGAVRSRYPDVGLEGDDSQFTARLVGAVATMTDASNAYRLTRERLDKRVALRNSLMIWDEMLRDVEKTALRMGLEGGWFMREGDKVVYSLDRRPTEKQKRDLLAHVGERYGEWGRDLFAQAIDDLAARMAEKEREAAEIAEKSVTIQPMLPELDASLRHFALQPLPAVVAPVRFEEEDASADTVGDAEIAKAKTEPAPEQTQPEQPKQTADAGADNSVPEEPSLLSSEKPVDVAILDISSSRLNRLPLEALRPASEPAPPPEPPKRVELPPPLPLGPAAPAFDPAAQPAPPDEPTVASLDSQGFYDQNGNRFNVGDTLPDGSRVTAVWSGGVVLQKKKETAFIMVGDSISLDGDGEKSRDRMAKRNK